VSRHQDCYGKLSFEGAHLRAFGLCLRRIPFGPCPSFPTQEPHNNQKLRRKASIHLILICILDSLLFLDFL